LILNNTYEADNFKRNELLLRLNNINDKVIERHNEMHNFRYNSKINRDFDIEKYTKEAFEFIEE
jgi:hypothetical protein